LHISITVRCLSSDSPSAGGREAPDGRAKTGVDDGPPCLALVADEDNHGGAQRRSSQREGRRLVAVSSSPQHMIRSSMCMRLCPHPLRVKAPSWHR
jgi:hypothetical protein